jgi:steroid 5-alpha reductase family enzyme
MTSTVMLASAGGALALMVALWLASVALRDASIVDSFWGVGFIVIAWICVAVGHGEHDRRLLLAILVTIWGARLATHIARRNHGKGEDPRYVAMRERDGARFWLTSLYRVFLIQAATMWVISLPLQAAASARST